LKKPYFSASRLTLYSDCSLKYKFNYIDKLSEPAQSIHLAYGSAIHKALEGINLALIEGELLYIEDVFQDFHDEWVKEIKAMNVEKDYLGGKLYYHGLNTLTRYYENHIDYEVIGAEQRFDVPIIYPDGTEDKDYNMSGIIDAVIKRKDSLIILDYKTSKEPYNRFKLDTSVQLAMYSYAFRHLLNNGKIKGTRKKKEDAIAYYVLLKDYDTLDGAIKLQKKTITEQHMQRMFYILKQTKKGIAENMYIPNYSSMCHWCEFKKDCLAFTGVEDDSKT